jgi:hypothetical protein
MAYKGIIGLVNKGQPRNQTTGALDAHGVGAHREQWIYLETDTLVDAKKVGIEGVSRYGKAALVTMAFDTAFCSCAGGIIRKRWRNTSTTRYLVEAVESLAGSGEFHWMCGNLLDIYATSESSFGKQDWL